MSEKTKPKEQKRAAGPKFQSAMPPDYAIRRPSPLADILREADTIESATVPSPPTPASPPSHGASAAPLRDFQKVANSISREAVPAGMFSGKSKQLYDYLYSVTRGAIIPKRSARVTREQLMKGAHIGAKVTLEQNIARLKQVGLIEVKVIGGIQGGNEYTIYLPEEVAFLATLPSPPSQPRDASSGENPDTLAPLETSPSSQGLSPAFQTTSGEPKTSFKTNTERSDDDEAFRQLVATLKQANREVTGREPSSADAARWNEIGEVLVTELKIAAGRTTVSSVPAFLAEHLRRRLFKKDKRQIEAEAKSEGTKSEVEIDASKCPDCFGTGMWYPQGYEKGVAKCRHEKLEDVSRTQ